jgi:hypothetical protein
MILFKRAIVGVSVIALLAVSACAGQTAAQVTQTLLTDTTTMAAALKAEMPAIQAVQGIPAANVAQAQAALADLQSVAGMLNTSMTTTAAQPVIQKIVADVTTFNDAVLPFAGATPVAGILEAANVLLPVLEVAVNLVSPVGAAANSMTPDQAVAVLKAAAAQ